jgi:hypothetical protein
VFAISVAFVYGRDSSGRHTSTAVLLDVDHLVAPLPPPIADALDKNTVQELLEFLSNNEDRIREAVRKAQNLGYSGGEIDLGKTSRPVVGYIVLAFTLLAGLAYLLVHLN